MCFDLDARPPLPPMAGSALDEGDVPLTSADGTELAAYAARATSTGGPGIIVLPDVRGLHPYYEELVLRFAEAGVHAVALDLYARTAGPGKRPEGFAYEEHARSTQPASIASDVGAAAAYLRSTAGGRAERVYSIGFCFGGRASFIQAIEGHGLNGVIGFYGWPVGPHRTGLQAPAEMAQRFDCPVLAIFGGADAGIPAEAIAEFDGALAEAGVPHESIVYDGAPHSFFDRRQDEFADASADAWRRVLEFVGVATPA